MKKIILLTGIVLSFTLSKEVLGQNKKLFTITVYESADRGYNKISVCEEGNKVENIEMVPFSYRDLDVHTIEINKILVKYMNQGYKIISEIRGTIGAPSTSAIIMVTTYRL